MKKTLLLALATALIILQAACSAAAVYMSDADEKLYNAIETGASLESVIESVSEGASIDRLRRSRYVSVNTVEFAVSCGRRDVAQWLINNGADTNFKTSIMGETLLMYTASRGEYELCRLLLENGADIFERDTLGDTALEYAARAYPDVPEREVDRLITLLTGNGLEIRRDTLSVAINGFSSGGCRYAVARRLTQALADSGIDTRLNQALEAAILGRNLIPVISGGGVNQSDRLSVVCFSAAFGSYETMRALAESGHDISSPDSDGATPLILAARYGNAEAARLLLEKNVKTGETDSRGKTALDIALETGNTEIAAMISDRESQPAAAFIETACCVCCAG